MTALTSLTNTICVVPPAQLHSYSNDNPACNWSQSVGAATSWRWQGTVHTVISGCTLECQKYLGNTGKAQPVWRNCTHTHTHSVHCRVNRVKSGRQICDLQIRWTRTASHAVLIKLIRFPVNSLILNTSPAGWAQRAEVQWSWNIHMLPSQTTSCASGTK